MYFKTTKNLYSTTKLDYTNHLEIKINPFKYYFLKDFCIDKFLYETQTDYYEREVYDIELLLSNIHKSDFKSFFQNLYIDTPRVLNKVKSLQRVKGDSYIFRLSTYLMRHGKKLNSIKLLLKTSHLCTTSMLPYIFNTSTTSWKSFYLFLVQFYVNYNNITRSLNSVLGQLTTEVGLKNLKNNSLTIEEDFKFNTLYQTSLNKLNFLFSFYIYKVDKQIYKNSRGKSGKYTFVWKYIAPYKRHLLISHWLMKEVRVSTGKTLQDRLNIIMKNFILTPSKTWIWKIKKFSLNYIYYNLRRSLAETYRTSLR